MTAAGPPADLVVVDAVVATMDPDRPGAYGLVEDGAVALAAGRIVAVGTRAEVAPPPGARTWSVGGRLVTPGLVDCHTHLVFGGHRADEFARRLAGASYEELARAGGGIAATVAATRAATDEALLAGARRRLGWLAAAGATTVEVKSGYGLDVATELRLLRIARRLGDDGVAAVVPTLLAHAIPPDRRDDRAGYVAEWCEELLPRAAAEDLAAAVDVFCETIAFTPDETDRILTAATALGLPVKVHAEQLTDQGGAALAARHGATSADHLEHLSPAGADAMAAAGTVAVLLPGASQFLGEARLPPVDLLRSAGVPVAVSTDCNPGTSPLGSLPAAMWLACTRFGLTPEEALAGTTRHAARALGLPDRGRLVPGARGDLAVWDVADPAELSYWAGADLLAARLVAGRPVPPAGPPAASPLPVPPEDHP